MTWAEEETGRSSARPWTQARKRIVKKPTMKLLQQMKMVSVKEGIIAA
jgi:hypothetical protein